MSRAANGAEDCWHHIGVAGDASCPELAHVGHCRNCPVYAEAGEGFFERPMPEEYRKDWTDLLRKSKEGHQAGTESVLVFKTGDEWLALPTTLLREIMEIRAVHRVPLRSSAVLLGLVNVRGEIQLCISLAGLLGIELADDEPAGNNSARRMIVADRGGEIWAFPADRIHGTHPIQSNSLIATPSTVERAPSRFTRGV